jgi:hypothetical protein
VGIAAIRTFRRFRLSARFQRATPPASKPPQGLTILDVMVAVAMTAIGFTLTRPLIPFLSRHSGFAAFSFNRFVYRAEFWIPILAAWTIGTTICRVVCRRSTSLKLGNEPGAAACCVASMMILFWTAVFVRAVAVSGYPPDLAWKAGARTFNSWIHWVSCYCGPAVAAGWFVVLFSGNRRFDRSWIEYAGRLLGIAWITLSLICGGRTEYKIFKEDLSSRDRLRDGNIQYDPSHPLSRFGIEWAPEPEPVVTFGTYVVPPGGASLMPASPGMMVPAPLPAIPPVAPGVAVPENDDSVAPDAPE